MSWENTRLSMERLSATAGTLGIGTAFLFVCVCASKFTPNRPDQSRLIQSRHVTNHQASRITQLLFFRRYFQLWSHFSPLPKNTEWIIVRFDTLPHQSTTLSSFCSTCLGDGNYLLEFYVYTMAKNNVKLVKYVLLCSQKSIRLQRRPWVCVWLFSFVPFAIINRDLNQQKANSSKSQI